MASMAAEGQIYKRTVNGIEEYECLLLNETKNYIVIVIDGKRVGTLNPVENHPNTYDRSAQKIWLSLGPHVMTAFGYPSQANITREKPSVQTKEHIFDISSRIDRNPNPNGSYNLPAFILEDILFKPYQSTRHH
ncbi:MAG: hypothetical protein HYT98_00790 [Candidatus Sungbacteria bacterium]|nr:hypothetical protein [Candidatus Sungbacteria bacterium]